LASGINHIKGTLLIAIPVGLVGFFGGGGIPDGLACALGCLSGIILSPDLDVEHRTESEYLIYRVLGKFLGAIWFAFWWPYGKMIPHRSPLSHAPILGTIIRILYIYGLGGILWFAFAWAITGHGTWLPMPNWLHPLAFWWLIGLIFADALHYIMDVLPFWKQHRYPWWMRTLRKLFR